MPLSEEQLFGQAAAAKKKREDDVGFFTSALAGSLTSGTFPDTNDLASLLRIILS